MDQINVLISLYRGYGLGDAVQMSAVLRHVAKYRPRWRADLRAEAGRYCIGRGILNGNCFEYGHNPEPDKVYDAEVQICLYDTWANWGYKPNTRVSSCLHERFGLEWDAECGRYQVQVRKRSVGAAREVLHYGRNRLVAIHYDGDSSPDRKNLSHSQADEICMAVSGLGCEPLVLDWRMRSPVPRRKVREPVEWGGDAEMVCAVISQCAAFVGIDSGPSKCASATDTPSLVVWTGHHPAPFHDPAPNTTHLVPRGYHGLEPVCNDPGVIRFFEENYNIRQYDGDPVSEVKQWLREVLA